MIKNISHSITKCIRQRPKKRLGCKINILENIYETYIIQYTVTNPLLKTYRKTAYMISKDQSK